jgi:hypothetical protein
MTERKSLLEQALDVCVYAPVGLAIAVTEELPELIDKGRARVNSQLTMAKMVGSFAVAQGQREAERVVRQATGLVGEGGRAPGGAPQGPAMGQPGAAGPGPWDAEAGPHEAATPLAPVDDGSPVAAQRPPTADGDGSESPGGPAPVGSDGGGPAAVSAGPPPGDASGLAIPGYDALSASQVVQRLAGLADDELEAVRAYEAATRGRKTILNRIAQLQGPGASE